MPAPTTSARRRWSTAITDIDTRQTGFATSQRQNKILIVLLAVFIVVQIVVLEYRS